MRNNIHPLLGSVLDSYEKSFAQKVFKRRQARLSDDKIQIADGQLVIVSTDVHTGKILDISAGENIVVNYGRSGIAHMMAGDDVDNHKIVSMMFGDTTGSPAVTDTGLFGSVILMSGGAQVKPVTFDFPDGPSGLKVRFTAVVSASEGNGGGTQIYQEACLIKGNGEIFSHKVTGVITKDATVVLTAAWTYVL